MRKLKIDYVSYLKSNPDFRFCIIDPPWCYNQKNSKLQTNTANATNYEYWGKNNRKEVLGILDLMPPSVDALFIWTTNPMLEATMLGIHESKNFRFRSLLTWEKKTVHGKQAKVMAHYFLNCTEFLVFVIRKKPNKPINRLKMPTHFSYTKGERTTKPKELETQLINKLGDKWAYIFSGPFTDEFGGCDIDLVDVCFE